MEAGVVIDTEFVEKLAGSDPVPGGGGASAYCGAIAAALASMVANLTVGKKAYMDVEQEVLGCLGRLSVLRARLIELIDADAEAFEPLAQAYRLPQDDSGRSEQRAQAIQEGLIAACIPPLDMMRAMIDVLHECDFLARHGSRMAISDAGACALIAKAALVSASLNVYINASSMDDVALRDGFRADADELIEEGRAIAEEIYCFVAEKIGAYRMD